MAQALKFGKGVWATKTGSSMAYSDTNDRYKPVPFNVERDSIATRVNKEGLIEVVGHDKLRIDYTDTDKGVALLENSSTNLILNSQRISLSPTKNGTFVDNFAISPDGTQNATKITATTTDPFFYQNVAFTAGDFTASIYVKGIGDSIGQKFRFAIGSNSHTANKYVIPSEWTRFEFSATMSSGTQTTGLEITDPAIVGDEVLVWGWQVEQSSYATSYIPTSGSTVQRAADVANNAGNSEVFNDSEGVLFADVSRLIKDTTFETIQLTDGSSSNNVRLKFRNIENVFYASIKSSNGSTNATLNYTFADVSLFNRIAVKYKTNDFSLFVNGFEVATSNSGNSPLNLSELNFESPTGTENFYGKTKEIGYYDEILTDSELEYLTSYRSLSELVKELNLNTL